MLHKFQIILSLLVFCAIPVSGVLCAQPAVETQPSSRVSKNGPIEIGHSLKLYSSILEQERVINVYLPPSYASTTQTYPVLVVIDGGISEDFHHISGIAQWATHSGSYQELIVVGIENIDRKYDLTSESANEDDKKYVKRRGGSGKFRAFIANDLLPWIHQTYRTQERVGIIGESLAALFITETFLKQPTLFTDYIAISPSLWWNNKTLSLNAAQDIEQHRYQGKRLFLTIADEGGAMQEAYDHLTSTLAKINPKGLIWTSTPRHDLQHNTIYHPLAFDAIRQVYAIEQKEK